MRETLTRWTCDRCKMPATAESEDATTVPKGWRRVELGEGVAVDLCPRCFTESEEW